MTTTSSNEKITQPLSEPPPQDLETSPAIPSQRRGWRFWAVFLGLLFSMILAALEASVLATALPTIINVIDTGSLYIWTINAYFVGVAAVQPLFGQMADIFGRRYPMIACVMLFALGSGLCGGANSTQMLIAARIIQGFGGGGIFAMVSIVVADLVPLRERQMYMSVIQATFALGIFIGPVIGGSIVDNISWRWVFYINLPICGLALVLIFSFLRVNFKIVGTPMDRLKRVDFLGNAILMASVVAILIPLTWAGTTYDWSSWHIVIPLVLGGAGLVLFGLHQAFVAPEPTMPARIYGNRTSFLTYIMTFLHGAIMAWLSFFLPVYFQVLLEATPLMSGVYILATVLALMPAGIVAGLSIAKTGRYKPQIIVGFCLLSTAAVLLSTLTNTSSTVAWVCFQIIGGVGGGVVLTSTLPAIQAPLAEGDVAGATASWAFIRSFGSIFGTAIPAAVFNSYFDQLLPSVSDPSMRQLLQHGGGYEHATRVFMAAFNGRPELKAELLQVYAACMQRVWQVLIAFAVLGVLLAFCIEEIELRKELNTAFGLKDEKKRGDVEGMPFVESTGVRNGGGNKEVASAGGSVKEVLADSEGNGNGVVG